MEIDVHVVFTEDKNDYYFLERVLYFIRNFIGSDEQKKMEPCANITYGTARMQICFLWSLVSLLRRDKAKRCVVRNSEMTLLS